MLPSSDVPLASLLLPYLPEFFAADDDVVPVEEDMRPALIERLMLAIVRSYFEQSPTSLLVIEDAHWMDVQSWRVVYKLVTTAPSARLLLTLRPLVPAAEPLSPDSLSTVADFYSAVKRHERCRQLLLDSMNLRASAQLAAQFLGCRALSSSLARTIHDRSDGIPLFIRHLCLYMRERQTAAYRSHLQGRGACRHS